MVLILFRRGNDSKVTDVRLSCHFFTIEWQLDIIMPIDWTKIVQEIYVEILSENKILLQNTEKCLKSV